jgi:hypothetical protein
MFSGMIVKPERRCQPGDARAKNKYFGTFNLLRHKISHFIFNAEKMNLAKLILQARFFKHSALAVML